MAAQGLAAFVAAIVLGWMIIMADDSFAQFGGGGGGGGIAGQMGIPAPTPGKPTGGPETNIIPSISLQERYDSNVYFIPGRNLEDYVTTLSPQLRVVHKSSLIDGTVGGGATGEIYAKNPGLNYVGGNGLLDLNLSRLTNELVRGLGLHLSDSFRYTPQPPAFAAPTGGGELPESFVQGIQARRANSYTNAGRVEGSYAVSPVLSFTSTYMDQRIRFGRIESPPGGGTSLGQLFGTTFQTVNTGPVLKASPLDTFTLHHQYQKGTFDRPGNEGGFSTQGVLAGWTRVLTPTLTASVTGGLSVFDRNSNVQYLGSASLAWKGEATDLTLSYSRVIAPSFYVATTAMLSQMVRATASYRVTESLSFSVSGNYAHSESVPNSGLLQFDSYAVTPNVTYKINRILTANLSYTHAMFDRKFVGQEFSFNRDMALIRLAAEWN